MAKNKGINKEVEIHYKEISKYMDDIKNALDGMHNVNISELSKFKDKNLFSYKNNTFTYKEIIKSFGYSFNLLSQENAEVFLSALVLRNAYEEMMFYMASYFNRQLKVEPYTKPKYYRNIVKEKCKEIYDNSFNEESIDDMYDHMCKIVHVSSIKEASKYLASKQNYKKHITTELKCQIIIVECMLLQFLWEIQKYEYDLHNDCLVICSYISMLNAVCFNASFDKKHIKKLERFICDKETLDYLQEERLKTKKDVEEINKKSKKYSKLVKKALVDYERKCKELGYSF